MAEAATKTMTEDVPPDIMKLVDDFVRRYGIRKANLLLDKMEALHNLMEEGKQ